MNPFDEAKQVVTVPAVAEIYGLHPNRAGYIRCIVHAEKTPSCKLYRDRWYCFGCGAHGTVIDFTMRLFDLDAMGAVRKLDADFNLCLPLDRRPTEQERTQAAHRAEVNETYNRFNAGRDGMIAMLNDCFRMAFLAVKLLPPDLWTDSMIEAVKYRPLLEWWSDALTGGELAEQMGIFRCREEVAELCVRILSSMPPRSSAA